jgi:hypothetical protein
MLVKFIEPEDEAYGFWRETSPRRTKQHLTGPKLAAPRRAGQKQARVLRTSWQRLLVSQRHHWINSHRSPRWQVTRDERDEHQ